MEESYEEVLIKVIQQDWTSTLLDCHGRYAQNVAFFNVMTEAHHKYDHSEATGSSSWDFQNSFRRERLEPKSPDSKTLQEESP
ncbi:Zinc finger protein 32, partial [Galemys pyrenaicus]